MVHTLQDSVIIFPACVHFLTIPTIAGVRVCESSLGMCLCTLAHHRGLVVRASLDWPINYDGLLMNV